METTNRRGRPATSSIEPKNDNVESTTPPTPVAPNDNSELLKIVQELQRKVEEQDKEIKRANGDISEDLKESKRRYGYNLDGSRRPEEMFEYGYKVYTDNGARKAVIKIENIGRSRVVNNYNKGTRQYIDDRKITFHDGSTIDIGAVEFGEAYDVVRMLLPDENVKKGDDGKLYYTFDTKEFGTFTVGQDFING